MSELLKYKMTDYEVIPPKAVWDTIEKDLEEQKSFAPIADKLYPYEAEPPADAWENILQGLDNKLQPVRGRARSISISKPKIVRWLAAATIIGLLLTGSYFFLNNSPSPAINSSAITYTDNNEVETKGTVKDTYTPRNTPSLTPRSGRTYHSSYHENNQKRYYAININNNNYERPLYRARVEDADHITDDLDISITPRPILNDAGEVIQDMSIVNPSNDKYITITAPNGQQTKISSKLASAILYLSGYEQSGDHTIDSETWSRRIREWRDKIMQSTFVPSSNNFLDILEFSELIRE